MLEKWRRAGDSNPDTGYPVVDFKFEPPLPSGCRHRPSSLRIMPLRGALTRLKVRCRPMTTDGDSQEIAKQEDSIVRKCNGPELGRSRGLRSPIAC